MKRKRVTKRPRSQYGSLTVGRCPVLLLLLANVMVVNLRMNFDEYHNYQMHKLCCNNATETSSPSLHNRLKHGVC